MKQKTDASTKEPEPFDEFVSRFRLQTAQYDFRLSTYKDEMNSKLDDWLIQQIIAERVYAEIRRDLLAQDGSTTLGNDSQIAKTLEASTAQTECHHPDLYLCRHRTEDHVVYEIQGGARNEWSVLGTRCWMYGKCNHWARACKAKRKKMIGSLTPDHNEVKQNIPSNQTQ